MEYSGYNLKMPPFSSRILLGFIFMAAIVFIMPETSDSATQPGTSYTYFIKSSCNTTTYPSLCYQSLSPFASTVKTNPLKLCTTALGLTVEASRNASGVVSKISKQEDLTKIEAAAVKDCIENLGDCVYELKRTLQAMGHLRDPDGQFQLSNAKTWASAAITDTDTCLDGFSGRKVNPAVKSKIRNSIVVVARLTSNALALINHLKY